MPIPSSNLGDSQIFDPSRSRHSRVTSAGIHRDEHTHWRIENQALAAGLGSPANFELQLDEDVNRKTRRPITPEEAEEELLFKKQQKSKVNKKKKKRKGQVEKSREERRDSIWRQKADEEKFVDLTFIGNITTGMELLADVEVIYLREVARTDPAVVGKPDRKVFEIIDHNGERLYLLAGKKLKHNAFLEFTWFDYRGQRILKTSGKFGGLFGTKMEVWLPTENSEKDAPIGIIRQKVRCRPQYEFQTEDKLIYKFESLKGHCLCYTKGKRAPHSFDIIEPEYGDQVGSIYKLEGHVNFVHQDIEYGDPIPNFSGCAIHFVTAELGAQTKAMMICGAFLLLVQHFQKKGCASWNCWSLASLMFFAIIFIVFGFLSLISFFAKNEMEDKPGDHLRIVDRTDEVGGSVVFADPIPS